MFAAGKFLRVLSRLSAAPSFRVRVIVTRRGTACRAPYGAA